MGARGMAIAGGTSEVTRNQIAERILGMPRDPLIKLALAGRSEAWCAAGATLRQCLDAHPACH